VKFAEAMIPGSVATAFANALPGAGSLFRISSRTAKAAILDALMLPNELAIPAAFFCRCGRQFDDFRSFRRHLAAASECSAASRRHHHLNRGLRLFTKGILPYQLEGESKLCNLPNGLRVDGVIAKSLFQETDLFTDVTCVDLSVPSNQADTHPEWKALLRPSLEAPHPLVFVAISCLRRGLEKILKYGAAVEDWHGALLPLVFSSRGAVGFGVGQLMDIFRRHLLGRSPSFPWMSGSAVHALETVFSIQLQEHLWGEALRAARRGNCLHQMRVDSSMSTSSTCSADMGSMGLSLSLPLSQLLFSMRVTEGFSDSVSELPDVAFTFVGS